MEQQLLSDREKRGESGEVGIGQGEMEKILS